MPCTNRLTTLLAAGLLAGAAHAAPLTAEQQKLRSIYQELVEINTTNSVGSCTVAATAMAARLKAGGYADSDLQIVIPPGGPKKGNLVARLKGSGAKKPLLFLAHIDVVEANPADWVRDPFKLVEENGEFYARGSRDDKSMAAVFVANMIRYKQEHLKLNRDLIMALTCDEELATSPFDGANYLARHHRDLIDAELAINEGGSGLLGDDGKPLRLGFLAGEKLPQSFDLVVTNKGGHSALPTPDNAITQLSDGLGRLGKFAFPFRLTDTTRTFFERMSQIEKGQVAADMQAILKTPPDAAAMDRLYAASPFYNGSVRTTCVPTMIDGGLADNALPQRAHALVNCRILPGESVAQTQATLTRVLADPQIAVTPIGIAEAAPPTPVNHELMAAVESIGAAMWPGVPVVPTMVTGATDGRHLNAVGIWTYGVNGMFSTGDGGGMHGINEHMRVQALYEGQEFLYRLGKKLGGL